MICLELHAHLNGSLSPSTIEKLRALQLEKVQREEIPSEHSSHQQIITSNDPNAVIKSFFSKFKEIYELTKTLEQLRLAVRETLLDFQKDGVIYLELRSTPRAVSGSYTKKEYIETVLSVIREFNDGQDGIITRFIVSIDRRHSIHESMAVIELIREINDNYIVGVDLCGDPTVNSFINLKPIFERARQSGLKITLHCGEVEDYEDVWNMIDFGPDRIGHATWLTDAMVEKVIEKSIGVEICMTSNILCQTVPSYEAHHFKQFYSAGVKMCICTDDKGIFGKNVSDEYAILRNVFKLDEIEISNLASGAVDLIFADEHTKKVLLEKFSLLS